MVNRLCLNGFRTSEFFDFLGRVTDFCQDFVGVLADRGGGL